MEAGELIDKTWIRKLDNEARIYNLNTQYIRKGIDKETDRLTKIIRVLREKIMSSPSKEKAEEYENDKKDFIKLRRHYKTIRKMCVEYNSKLFKARRRFKRIASMRYYTEADVVFIEKYNPEEYQTFIQKYYKKFVKG